MTPESNNKRLYLLRTMWWHRPIRLQPVPTTRYQIHTRRDNNFTGGYQTTDTEIKCHHIAQYVFAAKTVVAMRTRCRSKKRSIEKKRHAKKTAAEKNRVKTY